MKIMILSSFAPTLFFFREEMMLSMIHKGYKVIVAAPESECEWAYKFQKINIEYISIHGVERTSTNPLKDIRGFLSILRVILKEKPDKIFTYQAKTVIYGCFAAKLAGITEIYVLMGGLGSVFRNQDKKNLFRNILKFEYRSALNFCKNIFIQNKDDLTEMNKANIVSESKVVMINGSGVNLTKFTPKKIPPEPVFLFVGRIIRDKGIMEYIKAAEIVKEKHPEARMQIVGYFDTNPTSIGKEEIQKYIDSGVIEYQGSTEDVRSFLEKCSVFVLPSYHEGTPKSVLEAMATGRPIITTDAPGCRETVQDGVNGFLVPVQDVCVLAEKMIWMIENRHEIEIMGQASLRICKEKYDVDKVNHIILKTMGL